MYGSDHHKNWMWQTKSVNSITVNGQGQRSHSADAMGRITAFQTDHQFDYVEGEAGGAYHPPLERFTRSILFIKPELIVIYDRLEAREPCTFEFLLHAISEMKLLAGQRVKATQGDAACTVTFLHPTDLEITQTDKFDPPPRPRVNLTEWHLTAATREPARRVEFITLLRPHRAGQDVPAEADLTIMEGAYVLNAELTSGQAKVLLRFSEDSAQEDGSAPKADGLAAVTVDKSGQRTGEFRLTPNSPGR